MTNLLTGLVNQIFPPRDTQKIIDTIGSKEIEQLYSPGSFSSVIYLAPYQNKIIQSAILENKFHHNKKATKFLGELLEKWLKHQILDTLFVPIPLSSKRKRDRGYNQVEEILKQIDKKYAVNKSLLRKKVHTLPQTELTKQARLNNLKGVFSYHGTEADLSKFQQIVIVDDVVTTGTTLQEARATLAPLVPAGIKITCLAIAH